MQRLIERYPVLIYVALCYAITWSIWFAIPLFSGGNWTVIKVMVGIGMGPGLAAVLLDRARGTAGAVDRRWWTCFSIVFVVVLGLNSLSLLTGDGATAAQFAEAAPVQISAASVIAAVLSAAVCGFIFASAAVSRSAALNSILAWRVKPRWWLVALFLPAALLTISLAIALPAGEEVSWPRPAALGTAAWAGYLLRSILFTLFVVGIGEETGWRGWMLPELLKRYSALRSSIVVGVVWGLWHFPLYVIGAYPGDPSNVLEYLVIGPLLAILFTWLWCRSGGNLLLAIVLHMAINNSPRVLPATGPFTILLIAVIAVVVFTDKMWRFEGTSEPKATSVPAV